MHFLPFFENAPDDVVTGSVRVLLEKRVGLIIMQFNLNAELHAPCDRCLADIKIPLQGDYKLLIKFKTFHCIIFSYMESVYE